MLHSAKNHQVFGTAEYVPRWVASRKTKCILCDNLHSVHVIFRDDIVHGESIRV